MLKSNFWSEMSIILCIIQQSLNNHLHNPTIIKQSIQSPALRYLENSLEIFLLCNPKWRFSVYFLWKNTFFLNLSYLIGLLWNFVRKMRKKFKKQDSPILCHCSPQNSRLYRLYPFSAFFFPSYSQKNKFFLLALLDLKKMVVFL